MSTRLTLLTVSVLCATISLCVRVKPQEQENGSHVVSTNGAVWNLPVEKILSRDEMSRILAVAKERSARDYVFFATCANIGLRLSEVAHIRKDDVLRNNQLRVTRRKKKVLQPTVIDILPNVHAMLTDWAQMFDGYLFPGAAKPCTINRSKKGQPIGVEQVCAGGHISLRCMQRDWALHVAEAGLRMHGRGIHSTRHFAITEFYDTHRDLRACQLFAGHSNSAITERYASVRDMKEKVNAMSPML